MPGPYGRYMFQVPPVVTKTMFVVMAVLFALSLVERNPLFVFHAVLGLSVAGYLVGALREGSKQRR